MQEQKDLLVLLKTFGVIAEGACDLPMAIKTFHRQLKRLVVMHQGNPYRAMETLVGCILEREVEPMIRGTVFSLWKKSGESEDYGFELNTDVPEPHRVERAMKLLVTSTQNGAIFGASSHTQITKFYRPTSISHNSKLKLLMLRTLEWVLKASIRLRPESAQQVLDCLQTTQQHLSANNNCYWKRQALDQMCSEIRTFCAWTSKNAR